ncbi:hypothetical protein HOY82DRAFT_493706 [Tuber indicum]|nr:hypothetical protein HOY82DRAFT_493706 [Tuber indicum]
MTKEHFEPPLASLSFSHVYYNPDDPVSLLCAWLALLPQALGVSYATLVIAQREIEVLLMFAGQLSCEALNWALKRYFKQGRPKQMYGNGYGMPSSHAQFMAFFAVYFSLWIHRRSKGFSPVVRWALSGGILAVSATVALSRIYLSYHTAGQVACGYFVGALFAVVWFLATAWMRVTDLGGEGGMFDWITGGRRLWELVMWIGGLGYVKDLCTEVDIVRWEWEVWRRGSLGVTEGAKILQEEKKRI